jgi:hypothetical protein
MFLWRNAVFSLESVSRGMYDMMILIRSATGLIRFVELYVRIFILLFYYISPVMMIIWHPLMSKHS